jgi:hypothetical protein
VQPVTLSARYFLSLGNVFFSLILGALAFGFFWFYFPDATLLLFKWAGTAREWMVTRNWSSRYEVVVRALVDERQIVYIGFVLFTRMLFGLIIALGFWLLTGRRHITA